MYFSWGNIIGHAEGSGYNFSQDEYNSTPAAAITANLSLSQDAARANLGAPWRMPTYTEFQELKDNCTNVWTTLNGVYGRLFTSNVNGRSIFLPAAGLYRDRAVSDRGTYGFYWTSVYVNADNARSMYFSRSSANPQSQDYRRYGFSVRAVVDPAVLRRSLDNISILDVSQIEVKKDDEELKDIDAPDKPLNEDESR